MSKRAILFYGTSFLFIFLSIQASSYLYAQTNTNSISGIVYSVSGIPVSDVYVELLSDRGSTLTRAKTNGVGLFYFRGLPTGYYRVRVLTFGTNYEEQIRRVALIGVSSVPGRGSVNEQVDFYLKDHEWFDHAKL